MGSEASSGAAAAADGAVTGGHPVGCDAAEGDGAPAEPAEPRACGTSSQSPAAPATAETAGGRRVTWADGQTQQHDTACYTPCHTLYSVFRLCNCFLCKPMCNTLCYTRETQKNTEISCVTRRVTQAIFVLRVCYTLCNRNTSETQSTVCDTVCNTPCHVAVLASGGVTSVTWGRSPQADGAAAVAGWRA